VDKTSCILCTRCCHYIGIYRRLVRSGITGRKVGSSPLLLGSTSLVRQSRPSVRINRRRFAVCKTCRATNGVTASCKSEKYCFDGSFLLRVNSYRRRAVDGLGFQGIMVESSKGNHWRRNDSWIGSFVTKCVCLCIFMLWKKWKCDQPFLMPFASKKTASSPKGSPDKELSIKCRDLT